MSSTATISSQSAFASIVSLSLELDALLDTASGDTVAEKMQHVFVRSFDQEQTAFSLTFGGNWFLRWCERSVVFTRTHFGCVQVLPYSLEENLTYLQALFNEAVVSEPAIHQVSIQERFSQRFNSKFSGNCKNAVKTLIDRVGFTITNRHLSPERMAQLNGQVSEIRTLFSKMFQQDAKTTTFIDKVLEIRSKLRSLHHLRSENFVKDLAQIKEDFICAVPHPLVLQDDKNNYFDILFQIRAAFLEHAIHVALPVHARAHDSCPISVAAALKSGQGSFTHTLQSIHELLAAIRKEVDELQREITQHDRANTHLWDKLSTHETTLMQCLNTNAKSVLCGEVDQLTKCVAMRITQSTTLAHFYPLYSEIRRCTYEMVDLAGKIPNQELGRELQEHMEKASKELQEVQMDHYLQLLRSEALPQVRKVLADVMESKDPVMVHTLERNIHNALSFLQSIYREVAQVRDPHQLQVIWELITTLGESKEKLSGLKLPTPSGKDTTARAISDDDEHAKSLFSSIVGGAVPPSIVATIKQYGPSVLFTTGITYLTGGLPLGMSLLAGLGATAGAKLADGTAQQLLPKPIYDALGPFVDCGARLAVTYLTKGAVELTDFHPWAFRNSSSSANTAVTEKPRGELTMEPILSLGSAPTPQGQLTYVKNETENMSHETSAVASQAHQNIEWQAPDCVVKAFAYLATGMTLQQKQTSGTETSIANGTKRS